MSSIKDQGFIAGIGVLTLLRRTGFLLKIRRARSVDRTDSNEALVYDAYHFAAVHNVDRSDAFGELQF